MDNDVISRFNIITNKNCQFKTSIQLSRDILSKLRTPIRTAVNVTAINNEVLPSPDLANFHQANKLPKI